MGGLRASQATDRQRRPMARCATAFRIRELSRQGSDQHSALFHPPQDEIAGSQYALRRLLRYRPQKLRRCVYFVRARLPRERAKGRPVDDGSGSEIRIRLRIRISDLTWRRGAAEI